MTRFTDQLGTELQFSKPPQRIVSLVPSQSEFLYELGIGERLVGVTKFCVHPKDLRNKVSIIGGTKEVKVELVKSLTPDFVVANLEENTKEDIDQIRAFCQVYVSDVKSPDDALLMMSTLADILKAPFSIQPYEKALARLDLLKQERGTCIYFIWKKPYMAAGGDTYINSMLRLCGFSNVLESKLRYPEIDENKLVELNPEWVLLSSEPFPFKDKHISDLQLILPNARIKLVDGEAFSWYGSRIIPSVDYLVDFFKPRL